MIFVLILFKYSYLFNLVSSVSLPSFALEEKTSGTPEVVTCFVTVTLYLL